ncbi:pentatricopeptide repeat protein [Aspergillus lucknowensis]|uniref:Sm domain-containing protein n=1 Tax=Aspergillus lucknowensis TaxID=176173 RepID=A0ABR4M7Y9_9EURO
MVRNPAKLPLGLLTAAQGHPMLVELKNGETLNGHLANCDNWMNLILKEVVQTSPEGDRFFRLPEVYIRGNNIKYLRIPEEIIEMVKEQQQNQPQNRNRGPREDETGKENERPALKDGNARTSLGNEQLGSKSTSGSVKEKKRSGTAGVPMHLLSMSRPKLEATLHRIAEYSARMHAALQILRLLIRDRKARPKTRHYKWLIQCNSDPERGSPILVRQLLSEMQEYNIPIDSGTFHAALQPIAVHPDYTLRQDLLRAMRDRWLPLSPDGWHYVVAGLIREHQFELALDHIAHMERKDIRVKAWLCSLLIYHLCEVKEFDQICQILRARLEQGHTMTSKLWAHVLDMATAARHYSTTRFVWERAVELGLIHPDREVCIRVLKTATKAGDAKLGNSVLHFLSNNGIALEVGNYKIWMKMHLISNNLPAAIDVLCEVERAGHALEPHITRLILRKCIKEKIHPRELWAILKELKSAGRDIPLACARIVFELCEEGVRSDPFQVDDGIAFYKELYTLCSQPSDTATFNVLIRMCGIVQNAEYALFLLKEMAGLGVMPDADTYGYLIVLCLECGNSNSAYLYLQDMLEQGFHLNHLARFKIQEFCRHSGDEFAAKLLAHPEIRTQVTPGSMKEGVVTPATEGHGGNREPTETQKTKRDASPPGNPGSEERAE